jgi:hypothetical protein
MRIRIRQIFRTQLMLDNSQHNILRLIIATHVRLRPI